MSQRRGFTLGAKLGTPSAIGQTVKGQDFHKCSNPACHRIFIASSESIGALELTIWSSHLGCSTGRPRGCTDCSKEPAPTMACVALKTGESTPSHAIPLDAPPPRHYVPTRQHVHVGSVEKGLGLILVCMRGSSLGHEATDTGLAYAPVSQAHGHNHIVQSISRCTAAQTSSVPHQVVDDCAWTSVIWTLRSARTHHPPTVPVSP